jgi:YggT family protein
MRWVAPFIGVIDIVLSVILWVVFAWVILSWIVFFASQTSFRWRNRSAYNILVQLDTIFTRMAYPFVKPFRRILPAHKTGGIDWSPMLLFLVIYLIRRFLWLILAA